MTTCAGEPVAVSDATVSFVASGFCGGVGINSLKKPGRNCSNRSLVSVHNKVSSPPWELASGGSKTFEAFMTSTRFFNDSGIASN